MDSETLQWFEFSHLPEHLREVSKPFADLAYALVLAHGLFGTELEVALRKLLEAKDAAVRAAIMKAKVENG